MRERIQNLQEGSNPFDPRKRQLVATTPEAEEDFDLDRRLAATKQTGLGSGGRTIHKETLDEPREFDRAPSTASFSHLKPAKRISEPEIASLQSLQDNKRSLKDMSLEERRALAAERLSKRRNSIPPLAA